ncbi:AAA family ATPase [Chryseobacterium indoltheticum]|uniref:AAA family ATPase n=1 Tax=Chryseobacterium indoltheticum TaxID=254 RepID=UPI001912ADC6|nr:AAA family ATPase [Chryseobacterium indoltheticum]
MITGGSGVSKTTLINFLKSKGFAIVLDSARTIIKDQVNINGEGPPWKNKHLYKY